MLKMFLGLTFLIVGLLVLTSCGGGGGGGSSNPLPGSGPQTRPYPVQYGYFGFEDGNAVEQADHVSYVFLMDWGTWDSYQQPMIQLKLISQLQEAKARGIEKAVVAVGFLAWDQTGNIKGTQYLKVFRTQLEALGLLDMVVAFYSVDEPDLYIKEGRMTLDAFRQGVMNIHEVFPDKRLMVIYGDGGFPLIEAFDIVGKDKYNYGPQNVPINQHQTMALVAGGADPFREDPEQYFQAAQKDIRVEFVVAFLFVDYTFEGKPHKGIRNNGMLPAYKAVAQKLKALPFG